MSIANDYLIRNIQELAGATLSLMGLRPGDELLEEIEIDVEQHLGVPINMFEGMTTPALVSFVTMAEGPEPRKSALLGLALAARCEKAADDDNDERVAMLRPKALALLRTAFEREPPLRSPEVDEVYEALREDEADA